IVAVKVGLIFQESVTNKPNVSSYVRFERLPVLELNDDGVSARNAVTLGKEKVPGVAEKLSEFWRCTSPPYLIVWLPFTQLSVSEITPTLSPRPCGNPLMPPKVPMPVTEI